MHLLEEVLKKYPERFARYSNLYSDLSANSGSRAIMRDEDFGLKTYADRLFFATDMVNKDMGIPSGGWLDQQLAAGKRIQIAYN